ncbi:SRPBCC family protein [Rhodococcus kronopolitis]|uniref:SRPBCC family protein n=1 Tax=Rhodococcus kronopolitis TaxID=1460226 RepID=A0ABV9FXM0_9NOCA
MANNEIRLSRQVNATPASVWAVLTNLDGAQDTLSGVTKVERVSGPDYAVGTRWRETRKMFGKEATEEMWVAEVDPERRTVVKAHSSGTDYTTTFDLAPTADGTELTMTFTGETGSSIVHKVMMAVFGRLALKATTKMIAQDLADIAARAEQR